MHRRRWRNDDGLLATATALLTLNTPNEKLAMNDIDDLAILGLSLHLFERSCACGTFAIVVGKFHESLNMR